MTVNTNAEMAQSSGETLQKATFPRPARRKFDRAESVYEKALKCEFEKQSKRMAALERKLAETQDRLTATRKRAEGYQAKLCVYDGRAVGKPRKHPDPTLVKLSEAERLIALRVVHQYRQAANKELYLTKLKFAIGIDPLTDFAAPDSKGGA